jgi:hypothetical protein
MDLWPLLTEDLLSGAYSIERHLRPRITAAAIRSDSLADARDVVIELCTRWAGGFSPLVVVDAVAAAFDDRMLKVLLGSNIDGLEGRQLLPKETEQKYSDRWANASQWLLRQITELRYRPVVQTCRDVPTDHAWYPAYLVPSSATSPLHQITTAIGATTFGPTFPSAIWWTLNLNPWISDFVPLRG